MARLTRRESALAWNLNAPLDMELKPVPAKRVSNPDADKEWHLQRDCIAATRALMKVRKDLRFVVPGATQNNLMPAQRGFAKLMGWTAGWPDIWLMKSEPDYCEVDGRWGGEPAPRLLWHIVELKLPGKPLSDEQADWFAFLQSAGIPCSRVDTLADYIKILHGFVK